jgi:hypothetical protein
LPSTRLDGRALSEFDIDDDGEGAHAVVVDLGSSPSLDSGMFLDAARTLQFSGGGGRAMTNGSSSSSLDASASFLDAAVGLPLSSTSATTEDDTYGDVYADKVNLFQPGTLVPKPGKL